MLRRVRIAASATRAVDLPDQHLPAAFPRLARSHSAVAAVTHSVAATPVVAAVTRSAVVAATHPVVAIRAAVVAAVVITANTRPQRAVSLAGGGAGAGVGVGIGAFPSRTKVSSLGRTC